MNTPNEICVDASLAVKWTVKELEIYNQANGQMSKWTDARVYRIANVTIRSESGKICIVSLFRTISL